MNKFWIPIVIFLLLCIHGHSQDNVVIGSSGADQSALLEVSSLDKGLLIPRMSSAQRLAITSPAASLLVFDLDTNGFFYFDGSIWVEVSALSNSYWKALGNDAPIKLGTTNMEPFSFQVAGQRSGRLAATTNTQFGYSSSNFASLLDPIFGETTVLGSYDPSVTFMDTRRYTSIGSSAGTPGASNVTISYGVYIGNNIINLDSDLHNTFVGFSGNFAVLPSTFSNQTHIGYSSFNPVDIYPGGYSLSVGSLCGGDKNVVLGHRDDVQLVGDNNVFLGNSDDGTTLMLAGNNNTYVGHNAGPGAEALFNSTAIGADTKVAASNSFVLGSNALQTNVGINTDTPSAALEVNGYSKLGENASNIKTIMLTATSPAVDGGLVFVPHGLPVDRILHYQVQIEYSPGSFIPANYTAAAGYEFMSYLSNGNVLIVLKSGNSSSVVGDPCRIYIIYEE